MKKVALITGITGMVGSHLADYLLTETDWDIVEWSAGEALLITSPISSREFLVKIAFRFSMVISEIL